MIGSCSGKSKQPNISVNWDTFKRGFFKSFLDMAETYVFVQLIQTTSKVLRFTSWWNVHSFRCQIVDAATYLHHLSLITIHDIRMAEKD